MTILEYFYNIIRESQSPFVVELGACDGYHSQLMIDALIDYGKPFNYHLFEPRKDLVRHIQDRLHKYRQYDIHIHEAAIGAGDGNITFYSSSGEKKEGEKVVDRYYGSSSIRRPKLMHEDWPEMKFRGTSCPVVRLDTAFKDVPVIDFIWADIQGAEVDMIKGGAETLKRTKYLYTEYSNKEHYEGQVIGVKGVLDALGYEWSVLHDFGGDCLFINVGLPQ